MLTVLAIVHVIIGIGLVIFVLLQDPKGGGAGGMFGGGGGSNTVFGSAGAGNFLTATTKWFAILFAVSCLALTWASSKKEGSVLDTGTVDMEEPVPATPVAPDGAPAADAPATPATESAQ